MCGATQYFMCQMLKFPVEVYISTRQDVALPRGDVVFTRDVACGIYKRQNRDISARARCTSYMYMHAFAQCV